MRLRLGLPRWVAGLVGEEMTATVVGRGDAAARVSVLSLSASRPAGGG